MALVASIVALRRAADRVFAKVAFVIAVLETAAVVALFVFGLYIYQRWYA